MFKSFGFLLLVLLVSAVSNAHAVVVDPPVNTLVVGAGAAGIGAASVLRADGVDFVVKEFSNRPYGRVHSVKKQGYSEWTELGAMWEQEMDRNNVFRVGEEYDIATKKFDQGSVSVFMNGVLLTPEQVGAGVALYYEYKTNASAVIVPGMSNAQAFALVGYTGGNPLLELIISFFDEQFFADNFANHSALEWDYYVSVKPDRIVLEGYSSIFDAVVHDTPSFESKIHYNSKVVAVDASNPNGDVIVTYKKRVPQPGDVTSVALLDAMTDEDMSDGCNDNNFDDESKWATHEVTARNVICTVPLTVLRKGMITFTPPMPAPMQHAVDTLQAGVAHKVALYFDDDAGRRALRLINTNYIMRTSSVSNPRLNDGMMVFINEWHVRRQASVLSFSQGDYARYLETLSDQQVIDIAMRNLREVFGGITLNTTLPDPIGAKITHWGTRENYGMVYTTLSPESTIDDYEALKVPFGATGNVRLAGEHAAYPKNGYVHGAWDSGVNNGQAVVDSQ